MQSPLFIGSRIYRGSSYGAKHPLSIPRVPTVMDLCRDLGWLPQSAYRNSPRARLKALTAFHSETYLNALAAAERSQEVDDETRARHNIGTLSNPIYPEMFRRPATAAGGSILGAELISRGGVVYNPGGGTHHGMSDHANGFCYLNDPVLALLTLRAQGFPRIAYVDIDAHHCDGVEAAFHGAEGMLLISVHEERRWPFTGSFEDRAGGVALNIPVTRGLNDTEFRAILEETILPALSLHRPDAIVLQCGADALSEDPLARLELSNNALWGAVRAIRAMTDRLLVLGGGGYNPWSVARAWTGVWAELAGFEVPDRLPPEAERTLRSLTWSRRVREPLPENWFTTLRDPPREGAVRDEIRSRISALRERLLAEV